MLFWSKNKFLIIFLFLAIGLPILINKYSKDLFSQEASPLSSGTSPCLETNPPTLWIEKSAQSRRGYAPSGVKNTEIMEANLINCGEVKISQVQFKIKSSNSEYIEGANFTLYFLESYFNGEISRKNADEIIASFNFENPIDIVYTGSSYGLTLLGTLPNDYSGKTVISLESIKLLENGPAVTQINRAESNLVFVRKQ